MRLWSIRPQYLDNKGLGAAWREGLLAQKVLRGLTKGYRNHPQLERFRNAENPIGAIGIWLYFVWFESYHRGLNYNQALIHTTDWEASPLEVTTGQLEYEFDLLQKKLYSRDLHRRAANYKLVAVDAEIRPNAAFCLIDGPVESWERVKK